MTWFNFKPFFGSILKENIWQNDSTDISWPKWKKYFGCQLQFLWFKVFCMSISKLIKKLSILFCIYSLSFVIILS